MTSILEAQHHHSRYPVGTPICPIEIHPFAR